MSSLFSEEPLNLPFEVPEKLVIKRNNEDYVIYSKKKQFRYALYRHFGKGPTFVFIGCNPSTANEFKNDRTIVKVIKLAKSLGYGSLLVLNLFPIREKDSTKASKHKSFNSSTNRLMIKRVLNSLPEGTDILCGWGSIALKFDAQSRERSVRLISRLCKNNHHKMMCLKVSKKHQPYHPLYLPDALPLIPYKKEK